jgi:hypothetical protein
MWKEVQHEVVSLKTAGVGEVGRRLEGVFPMLREKGVIADYTPALMIIPGRRKVYENAIFNSCWVM